MCVDVEWKLKLTKSINRNRVEIKDSQLEL